MNSRQVILAPDFLSDLFELYQYVAVKDGKQRARELVEKIEKNARDLQEFPERGHQLPELAAMGIQDVQEIVVSPYRILYKMQGESVYILACIDSRRDLEQALIRRSL
jgi:plasmid stabilization system protein ParE